MNKFISLTKLQLKDFISRYQGSLNIKRGNLGKILVVLLFLLLLMPSIQIAQSFYSPFALMGNPELLITMMYIGAVMVMLFAAIPFILSIFFYSKDTTFLSSLPISESSIVFSKLSTIYLYLLVVSGFIMGPGLGVYLVNSHGGIFLIVPLLLTWILSPVLPLTIATIIILPIMRFVGGSNRRNLFSILGNILFLVIIIGLQMILTRVQTNPEAMQQIFSQPDGILRSIGYVFPPSIWMTKMIEGSFINATLFIGVNILFILLLDIIARKVYRKAILSFNQQGSTRIKQGDLYYRKRGIGFQLIKRNILIITSNPAFFLNTFISMFVPVLIFFMMLFTGDLSLEVLNSPMLESYRLYIFAGVTSSPAIIGSTSATAISREGRAFWQTKILPISLEDNIHYRVMTTILLSLFASLLLGIATLFFLNLSWMEILLGILGCVAITLFLAHIDFIINIYRPLLDWTNPTAAVKNNLNVTISLGIRVVIGALIYGISLLIGGLPANMFIFICIVLFFILFFIVRYLLYKVYVKKFREIAL